MRYSARNTLLNLIANSLFGAEREVPAPISYSAKKAAVGEDDKAVMAEGDFWKNLIEEANYNSVQTISAAALPEPTTSGPLSGEYKDAYKTWKLLSANCVAENVRVLAKHADIHKLMKDHGINYVIIKGLSTALYYKDPFSRTMGDVDLLVRKEDVERATRVLEEDGFVCVDGDDRNHHHYRFVKGASCVELHFGLNGVPKGEIGEKVLKYLDNIFDEAILTKDGGLNIPSDFHNGFIMILHNAHHMTFSGLGLRHLCDWAIYVNRMSDNFVELFEKPLKEIGMWEYTNIITAACTYGLGLPKQPWCKDYPISFLDEVLDDIYSMGNFGVKEFGTASQGIIQNTNNEIKRVSFARRIFIKLNKTIEYKWPLSKKLVILYPIGYVFFPLRTIYLTATGKKDIDTARTLKLARRRNTLYNKFHLFEP